MRSRVGHETIGDLLAIGNEFRTHCQRVVHAGFAALLVVVGGFAGEGRENKTKQRQPKRRPKMRTRKARTKSATLPAMRRAQPYREKPSGH